MVRGRHPRPGWHCRAPVKALASGGQPVQLDQMRPGDVISLFPDASHVGIYVGGGRMVHAQFEGQPVIVASLYRTPIHNVRRYR